MGLVFGFLIAKAIIYKLVDIGYLDDKSNLTFAFVGTIFAGLLIGWFISKSVWFSLFCGGIGTGIAIGAMTFAIAAYAINNGEVTSFTSYQIWLILFVIVGLIAACKNHKIITTYGTSLIGAYVFMHGWYLLFGGFPEEVELEPRLLSHERIKLTDTFIIYVVAFLVIFGVSSAAQANAVDNERVKEVLGESGEVKQPAHVQMEEI